VASPPLKIPTPTTTTANNDTNINMDEPDRDFEEALRLQRRATHFLNNKKYVIAVDEFSAALFLVPDDPILTPQLHVGRAHALNGQERFESAKNDALMALKHILRDREEDVSAAEAYSALGKSLYYSKDYQGSIEALEESERIWKNNGGKLSVFDEAYLEQCREALDAVLGVENDDGLSLGGGKSVMSSGVKSVVTCIKEGKSICNIPKLKPPRFVPREEVSNGMIFFNLPWFLCTLSSSKIHHNLTQVIEPNYFIGTAICPERSTHAERLASAIAYIAFLRFNRS
jgi:tetratricopeptide (TPR) repeat protein